MLGLGNSITGGAALQEFVVANITGLVTWLKADTGVTETSSGSGVVARWTDQVGSADWVSNASTKQPALGGSGVNTYLDFDGTDRLYQKDSSWNTSDDGFDFDFPHDQFDSLNVGGTAGFSVFAVVFLDTSNTLNKLFQEAHFQDDGTPGSGFVPRSDLAGTIQLNTGGGSDSFTVGGITASASAFNASVDPLSLNTKILISLEYAGGTNGEITVRKNGTSVAMTNNNTVTAGLISLGQMGFDYKGRIYEVLSINGKVSSSTRSDIESYLIDRHSIS